MMLGVVLPAVPGGHRPRSPSASPRRRCRRPIGARHAARVSSTSDSSLADLPTLRAQIARMRIETDRARAHLGAVLDSLESPDPATQLLVLEAKAAATEAAVAVTDLAMRTCGGAAFAGAHGIERLFRDARAPDRDGADERSGLRLHRPGAVRPGAVLMDRPLRVGAVMYDPKVSVIWEIIRDFFDARRPAHRRRRSTAPTSRRWTALLDRHHRHRLEFAAGVARRAAPLGRHSAAPSRCATPTATASRISWRAAAGPVRTLADLRNRTIATGAIDSPQATLIPLDRLRRDGLDPATGRHGPPLRRAGRQARRSRRRRARRLRMPDARRGGRVRDARSQLGRLDQGRHDRLRPSSRSSPRPIASTTACSRSVRISMAPPSGAGSTRCSRCGTTIRRTAR